MKRKRLTRSQSKKNFKRTASKVHVKNLPMRFNRGGIKL